MSLDLNDYISYLVSKSFVESVIPPSPEHADDESTFFGDAETQIKKRDKQYTELLQHYVKVTSARNVLKEIFKWLFCGTLIAAIITLIVIISNTFTKYVNKSDAETFLSALPLLITSVVGFVSAIISIPLAVTKYLFNTKEEDNITKIIIHTQEHDVDGRKWAATHHTENTTVQEPDIETNTESQVS